MQAFHKIDAVFDDPNLVGSAGLVPVMRLAERAGLQRLLQERLSVPSPNAAVKAGCVVAGMVAGADSIDDLDVLRQGATQRVMTGVRAPSTVGTFLRTFTFGHVRQLDAVSARVLAGLASVVPRLLAGTDAMAFVDIDDTIREVHGYKKQGAAYGYSGVKSLNAQLAVLSSPTCAPVIAASRLRRGNTVSGHGGAKLIGDAVATARKAGASGQVMVRADSGYYRRDVITAAVRATAWFSVTVRMNPAVVRAIAGIPEDAWTTIKYPRAIWDEDEKRWISEAQVAETRFTAFTSARKDQQVTCRLVVRRVQRLNATAAAAGQDELFSSWRHHGFVTNSTLTVVAADETHPFAGDHAIVEQVIAELKNGPLAHAPSGKFDANAAWLSLARLASSLLRAAGAAASTRHAKARWGHPADPTHRGPRPGRVLGPPTHAAPADELALGVRLGQPLGHRHRRTQHLLTDPATRPKERPDVEEPDRPAAPPRHRPGCW